MTVTLDQRFWMWDLVLLLALAIALRVHGLGTLSLSETEAGTALAARGLVNSGSRMIQQVPPQLATGPLEWLSAQSTRVFGDSEWSVRLPSALAGVLATIWVYLWGSHWFGAWVGRITGFLFAVWPWSVACGRRATPDSLLLFLSFLFVISVWKILEGNCLGHPMAEPPLVAGRKPLVPRRFLRIVPSMIWGLLALLVHPSALLVLVVPPMYLLVRLAWTWYRGKTEDCEFRRTLLYLAASLAFVFVAIGLTVFLNADFPGAIERADPDSLWLDLTGGMGGPGLVLGSLLLVGTGMAVFRGRPGWLVILAAWIPTCGALLYPFRTGLGLFSPSVPYLLLLLGIPFAWGFEVVREALNHWTVTKRHVSWGLAVSVPLLLVGIGLVSWSVLLSPHGTAAVLNGVAAGHRTEAADWRAMSDCVPWIGHEAAVVTIDPLLCLYYVGRADFLYPIPSAAPPGGNPVVDIPLLPDGRALLDYIDSGHEVWILGSRASFQASQSSREGAALWARITQPPSRVWEGSQLVVICWRGEGR